MNFDPVTVDGRPAFAARTGNDTTMIFSCGPPLESGTYGERMTRMLAQRLPEVLAIRWCDQIHGRLIASLSSEPGEPFSGPACVGRCDGLMTAEARTALVVWTADCVPILIAGGDVIAAVHAGWRGAAAGILPAVVRRFSLEYGVAPEELSVALGPAIGSCHYRVGPEVIAALAASGVPERRWRHQDRVDLRGFLSGQLEAAGVPPSARMLVGGCTACSPDCASYRRDAGRAGRQWSMIYRVG